MKKKILIPIIAVIICVAIFAVYWTATSEVRYRDKVISKIQEQIDEIRGNGRWGDLYISVSEDWVDDPVFMDYLVAQIKEMWQNKEYDLLSTFLLQLEIELPYSSTIDNTLKECFSSIDDPADACKLVDRFETRKKYNFNQMLNKNEEPISKYIGTNGTNPITFTPGEGYYADCEDESFHHRVGIEGSPLYDAGSVIYKGDFKVDTKWGVDLNKYYEESSYSRQNIYFRDNAIDFDLANGAIVSYQDLDLVYIIGNNELVWSGDYLFYFTPDGVLIGFCELE